VAALGWVSPDGKRAPAVSGINPEPNTP
jgi:hypothetical protein